jgi:hypothetical protein
MWRKSMTDVKVLNDLEPMTEEAPVIESPFIPGTCIQFAWDATSLEYLKRCPRLYQYTMIDGWRPRDENVHLRFGGEFHTALHNYELLKADNLDHDECMFHTVRELLYAIEDWNPDHKYKNPLFLIRSVIRYLDKYRNDPAKTLKLQNGKPAVEVSFRFELDFGPSVATEQPYVLCGHLDRVVDFNDEIFVMDHKTTTTTPSTWYWNTFDPHNQMTLYTLAGKIIFQTNIKGVIIDSGQILMEDTRWSRGTTYRTQEQLEEWLTDLKYWLAKAEEFAINEYWPMNDTACDKYGGCKFREICSKSPSVRETFLKPEFTRGEIWNPLKAR